jgi:hypothetical protein
VKEFAEEINMSNGTESVPPSETTQQEDKVEDAIHEQAAQEQEQEPETVIVSIEDIDQGDVDGD